MKIKIIILINICAMLSIAPVLHARVVSDTWAGVYKKISGDFSGAWSDTDMTGPDTDGYDTITFNLIPGSTFKYKFKSDPDSDGTFVFEPGFTTTSGNRELTVIDNGSGSMVITANWNDTPTMPLNLNGLSDSGKIHLVWDTPTLDTSLDVPYGGRYDVYYDTGTPGPNWVKANSDTIEKRSFTITGLINDSTYYYYVQSIDAYGLPGDSSLIDSAIPVPLVDVTFRVFVGEMDDSEVLIGYDTGTWYEVSLNNEGGTSYWAETLTLNAYENITYKFIIIDSNNNKTYEYPFASGYTHMFIYPDSTSITQVEAQGSWNSWGSKTSFTLYPDDYWRGDVNVSAGENEYKFVLNGSNYVFDPYNPYTKNNNSLLVGDAMQTSSYMRELTIPKNDTTLLADWEDTPLTPSGFTATPTGVSSIRLDWNKVSINEDIDSYIIEYTETPNDTTTWVTIGEVDGTGDSYIHNSLILGDSYYYRIWSRDYSGNISQWKNFTSGAPRTPVLVIFIVDASDAKCKETE